MSEACGGLSRTAPGRSRRDPGCDSSSIYASRARSNAEPDQRGVTHREACYDYDG
jgi:hypothetical protein